MSSQDTSSFLMLGLQAVGGIILVRYVYSVLSFIYNTFLASGVNVKKLGSWAVVTGATDGIGKAVAKNLAKRGINIVLVSRTPARLDETKAEIVKDCPVQVKTVQFDFASATAADYSRLKNELASLEIGVLYNNVGVSYDYAEMLQDVPEEKIDALVEVNNRSLVKLTRMVLPGMIERKRGAVVNVGSFYGSLPSPFYSVYCASKSFVDLFSKSMSLELRGTGVTCHNHLALFVATKLAIPNAARRRGSLFTPLPEAWAASSVAKVGLAASLVPYWPHALQAAVMQLIPGWMLDRAIYDAHVKIRRAALKKRMQQAEAAKKQ